MARLELLKRAPRRALELPIVVEAPTPDGCSSRSKICFAIECPSNLMRRLERGQHHPSRCDRDSWAPGLVAGPGERRTCEHESACLGAFLRGIRDDGGRAAEPLGHCPSSCPMFEPPAPAGPVYTKGSSDG